MGCSHSKHVPQPQYFTSPQEGPAHMRGAGGRGIASTPSTVSRIGPSLDHSVRTIQSEQHVFRSHYDQGRQLGAGSFAVVFVGIHINSGQMYAVKKIDRSKMFWGDRDALLDEIQNLTLVRKGPNIVQLYEVYQEAHDCYLVMELMTGGELLDVIIEKRTFTEKEARDVLKCILEGLNYMHVKRVGHRDLKPENLLLVNPQSDTQLKLADFGFAKRVLTHNGLRTLCGTPGYVAPEILERWPSYDTACDMWSVGVIVFLLLGGYLPFDGKTDDIVFDRTRNGEYDFHPEYWTKVSHSAKSLITTMLVINPSKRSTAAMALEHEWMHRTDEALNEKQLDVQKLKQTVLHGKGKMKAAVNAIVAVNRLKDLNDDFNSYLKKQRDDSVITRRQSIIPKSMSAKQVDDSATGKPFNHFYELGDLLGEGGFATVRRAAHTIAKNVVAVKIVQVAKLNAGGTQSLKDEISILKLLRGGPHIVRLFDVFKEPDHTYLVMELMKGGELLQRIVEKEVYNEREARQLCKCLFEAVDYCHKKNIAHRDLKPENLLLSEVGDDTSIKIADFGFATRVTKPNSLKSLCGTPEYVAPEVLDLAYDGYDQRSDMWSVGVIVYILLGGYAPFEGSIEKLAAVVIAGKYEFHEDYWDHISPAAKDLISSLLETDPNLRISAEQALQSDWMRVEAESLIGRDLSAAQLHIRTRLPVRKLRGAVTAVIACNKFGSLTEAFTNGLRSDRQNSRVTLGEIKEEDEDQEEKKMVESSTSEKSFKELYEVTHELGTGCFSTVHEVIHKESREYYAVKCVDRRDLHPSDAVALQDEITALKVVAQCEYIVKLHAVFEEPDTSYIVLEYMRGGDLIDRLIEKANYTEADAKDVCTNLLLGVEFCHKKRIANRNLKPENLLLVSRESDTKVKISDFGYAKKVLYPNALRTQCGTEGYVAPEILEHRPAYDVQCDMWSLGVVLYIVLGGYRPFRGSSDEITKQIRYGEYEFHERYWGHVSQDAKDLIKSMMTVDPDKRISASDALKSAWIRTDNSILNSSNLNANKDELKAFKGKSKLRSAVHVILAANKLQSLGDRYQAFRDF